MFASSNTLTCRLNMCPLIQFCISLFNTHLYALMWAYKYASTQYVLHYNYKWFTLQVKTCGSSHSNIYIAVSFGTLRKVCQTFDHTMLIWVHSQINWKNKVSIEWSFEILLSHNWVCICVEIWEKQTFTPLRFIAKKALQLYLILTLVAAWTVNLSRAT